MMLYDYYCHFNGIAAINKVLKYHPKYPSRPMQEITNNTIIGGPPPGSTVGVKYITEVEKVGDQVYFVTFLKDWRINSVVNYYKYKVTPFSANLIEMDNDTSIIDSIK